MNTNNAAAIRAALAVLQNIDTTGLGIQRHGEWAAALAHVVREAEVMADWAGAAAA
jgi:hypothetical protein